MKKLKSILILGFALVSLQAFAAHTQKLLVIQSEFYPGVEFNISLDLDDNTGDVLGLRYQGGQYPEHFFPSTIIRQGPQVLVWDVSKTHKVVILDSTGATTSAGGRFALKYLHDGILGIYRNLVMELDREGNHWGLFLIDENNQKTRVSEIDMTNNVFLGRVIGIGNVSIK